VRERERERERGRDEWGSGRDGERESQRREGEKVTVACRRVLDVAGCDRGQARVARGSWPVPPPGRGRRRRE